MRNRRFWLHSCARKQLTSWSKLKSWADFISIGEIRTHTLNLIEKGQDLKSGAEYAKCMRYGYSGRHCDAAQLYTHALYEVKLYAAVVKIVDQFISMKIHQLSVVSMASWR